MTGADPGVVLRRALVVWGLGHLALGRPRAALGLAAAEVAGLALVAMLTLGLRDGSAHLVPFVAGVAFIAAWAAQAVDAYRRARDAGGAVPPTPSRSPALAAAWLSLPLLLWGAGFWLVAGESASPAAILDRFAAAWAAERLEDDGWPDGAEAAVRRADRQLARLCRDERLAATCDATSPDRFREVRMRVVRDDGRRATAVAEAVRYERRDARLLGIAAGSEIVPVAVERLLTLRFESEPQTLAGGLVVEAARRWRLVAIDAPGG